MGYVVLAIAASGLYIVLLFWIAQWGDKRANANAAGQKNGSPVLFVNSQWATAAVYALTLAIYHTTWSFFGFAAQYIKHGGLYIGTYVGAISVITVWRTNLNRVIKIAKQQRAISIADFIACRYGKRQSIAVVVTVIAFLASIFYDALQLRSIGFIFNNMLNTGKGGVLKNDIWSYICTGCVIFVIAIFALIFGVRHIKARHNGMMLAIAAESVVKFVVMLGMCFYAYLFHLHNLVIISNTEVSKDNVVWNIAIWMVVVFISGSAFVFLPHMYHVLIFESPEGLDPQESSPKKSSDELSQLSGSNYTRDYSYGIYILYLVLLAIIIFLLSRLALVKNPPIITAAREDYTQIENYMMVLISRLGDGWVIIAFIGAFAAATGMMVVNAVSLATMICNVMVMPVIGWSKRNNSRLTMRAGVRILSAFRGVIGGVARLPFMGRVLAYDAGTSEAFALLLDVRRIAVLFIFAASYFVYVLINFAQPDGPLADLGIVAFAVIAHLAPAFIGGMYWSRGRHLGVICGVAAGLIGAVASAIIIPEYHVGEVLDRLTFISYVALCSLLCNVAVYIWVSIIYSHLYEAVTLEKTADPQYRLDLVQAHAFIHARESRTRFRHECVRGIRFGQLWSFLKNSTLLTPKHSPGASKPDAK
jgi:Na+/proline symporter